MKANELKKGAVFKLDGRIIMVKHVQVQAPSSRSGNTLYKVKGQDISSRQKFERSFKGEVAFENVDIVRRAVQLLFSDTDSCTFMDTESYEQYSLDKQAAADELPFIFEETEGLLALIVDGVLLGIELPTTVVLEIKECAPALKAASQSGRGKPATLNTGLVVQVPEYLIPGEKIKVNTDTREFVSRV